MQKNIKAMESGWVYEEKKHPVLNMHFAYKNTESGMIIMFEDKTLYNEEEIKILQPAGVTKNLHNIKKIFEGVIIQ